MFLMNYAVYRLHNFYKRASKCSVIGNIPIYFLESSTLDKDLPT